MTKNELIAEYPHLNISFNGRERILYYRKYVATDKESKEIERWCYVYDYSYSYKSDLYDE